MNLDQRQLATVLAALRFWQRAGLPSGVKESAIATAGGSFEALKCREIEGLCDRLKGNARGRQTVFVLVADTEAGVTTKCCKTSDVAEQELRGLLREYTTYDENGPRRLIDEAQIETLVALSRTDPVEPRDGDACWIIEMEVIS